MDPVTTAIVALLIFAVAFVYANLGLGGGLLFVPILLSFGVESNTVAVPISLTLTIAVATSSVLNHRRRGFVDARLGAALVAGALVGAVLGSVLNLRFLDRDTFLAFFTAVLVAFGVHMLIDWTRNARPVDRDDDTKMTRPRIGGTAGATLGSGFLSGSLGIGGGLLNVPLLVHVLGRRTRTAIGTSSLLIIPTAAVGFAAYVADAWPTMPPDFSLIPVLLPVVFVGAFIGSRWGLRRLRTRSVVLIFILVLFLAAAKLVVDLAT